MAEAERDSVVDKKAKLAAWFTGGALAVLYTIASGNIIGRAGLGGIVMLALFYVPLIPLSAVLSRLILTPVYRIILDKTAKPSLRKVMAGILALLAAAFCFLMIKTVFFSYSAVNDAVRDIPQIESYFAQHRDELEAKRQQAENGDSSFSEVYSSEGRVLITFNYDTVGGKTTGYKDATRYIYILDDYWYIEIYLMEAV